AFIIKNNLVAVPPQPDEGDMPDPEGSCVSDVASLNFIKNNIQSIIWATGFNVDHSYIKLPIFDNAGNLQHKDGIPNFPGIYFVGYPWLRVRGSTITFGIKEDAKFIAEKIFSLQVDGVRSDQSSKVVNV